MSDFTKIAALIKAKFDLMSKGELFTTAALPDDVYDGYLAAFPEGTNPIYRERTEHDCSCCRNFIRNIGNVVSIQGGQVVSVWDVVGAEAPYDTVAEYLSTYVKSFPVTGLFRAPEISYGAESNVELLESGKAHIWHHFHAKIDKRHYSKSVGADVGAYNTTVGVFKRGVEELSADAFNAVLELIDSKALYRGEEHLASIKAFQALRIGYANQISDGHRNTYLWANANNPASRFRNTVIGTLIQDLSAGMDLEAAVKSFEAKVAPENYKRPTALITPTMVKQAMATINELGLEPALERRFARLSDISVNNVLWVNGEVQSQMKGGLEGMLLAAAAPVPTKHADKAEDISIDDFMANVLPQTQSMEVLVKNSHQGNFVSLTAPVHADSGQLFKWGNDFAWSYDGNIADSIKERVKAAGGKTDAVLRTSLAWFNHDDLDIHVFEPGGNRIYFGAKSSPRTGGRLDVDMNAGHGTTRTPVENITWSTPPDGDYSVVVNNYSKRETSNPGFTLEVESNGALHQYSCASSPATGKNNPALTLTVKNRAVVGITAAAGVTGGSFSQQKWGVATEKFTKVNTMMRSPNYWDENQVGNKHWFFMLDGCKNDAPTRGIYNEFLNSGLEKHRKVFEILGDKTKCQPTDDQISGVGFSSTRGDSVVVNVTGAKIRKTYNITF